jgi:hypothetical protein
MIPMLAFFVVSTASLAQRLRGYLPGAGCKKFSV